nr:response regulator [Bradyrhizobium symbiodeficiens]
MLAASAKHRILKPIRLAIVDRQPIVLQGLKSVLGTQQDFDIVASASDGTSCLEAIRSLSPDVALIADTLPDLTASDILAIAKVEKLSTRLVFFTEAGGNHDLTAAIAAGSCSAISKDAAPGTMLQSLRLMGKSGVSLEPSDLSPAGREAGGGSKIEKMLELLTPRERQIVRLVSEGMSNKEIARQLDVSQGTVKVHLHNIFQKLEITNRTVLATISLLQRTSGFSVLALGILAFAIADELKASEANDIFAHDDGHGQKGEHAEYEVCKKAILQHLIVSKSGDTPPFTERDLVAKASQAASPSAAMEALRAAEQLLGSKPWKDVVAGSGTPSLPALLLRGTNDALSGGDRTGEDHLPRLASNPMSIHGAYGTFAALAGALIYELSDVQHAAQSHELDQASIDSFLASIGDNATKLAAITHVDANPADNAAPHFLSHDFGPHSASVTTANNIAQERVRGEEGADAAAHNLQALVGVVDPGHDPRPRGHSGDQLLGGNGENGVDRSPTGAKSASSDPVLDDASGPGRLNLAAFGALAWLHLTAAAKSIPPHTLAWIYDPASNQTIVYVNPTDHILDVGDRGLLEIHMQGIVSVAESDVVQQSGGAAVAVTLEQLEQALILASATDETASSMSSSHASEESLGEAGVWSASADDGLSFQFAHVRTGSGTAAKSGTYSSDSADATDENAGASGVPAYGSSIAPGQGASPPTVENLSWKNEPTHPNTGAASTKQSEMVQPDFNTADRTGHSNSEHSPEPGSEKATEKAETESKPGKAVGHGNDHHSQAPDSMQGAAKTAEPGGAAHGNSSHSASANRAEAGESAETPGQTEHGHSQKVAERGPIKVVAVEMAGAEPKPGNGVSDGKEGHSQALDGSPGAARTAESGSAAHTNSSSTSAKAADPGESVATHGNTDHGNAQQAAHAGANPSEAVPVKAAFKLGSADQEPVFRFDDDVAPSTRVAVVESKEHGNPHVTPGQKDAPQMIAEIVPGSLDEHAASHGITDPHHGVGPAPHDWLI